MISIETLKTRAFITSIATAFVVMTFALFNHDSIRNASPSISSPATITNRGLLETVVTNDRSVSSSSITTTSDLSATSSFADTFPDRNLVVDVMELHMILRNGTRWTPFSFDEAKLRNRLKSKGYNLDYVDVEKRGATVMIVTHGQKYSSNPIIVFRGTSDAGDAFTDANFPLVPTNFVNGPQGLKIHKGFHRAMFGRKAVYDIEKELMKLLGGKKNGNVIVAGYSLGHSNGHIMAAYLADKYPLMKVQMIGFGTPIVGNTVFKTWSENLKNLSVWRYVYKYDRVPRLHIIYGALVNYRYDYKHAGHLIDTDFKDELTRAYYHQDGDDDKNYAGVPDYWYNHKPVWDFTWSDHLEYHKIYTKANLGNDEIWPTEFERKSSVLAEE